MAETNAIERSQPQAIQTRTVDDQSTASRPIGWTYRPDVDIVDEPDAFRLIADLPGADANRIEVSVEDDVLTLQAEIPPRYPRDARFLRHEFGVGNYHRRFRLDDSLDVQGIRADYRDGVLTLTLPKKREAARRRIPINAG